MNICDYCKNEVKNTFQLTFEKPVTGQTTFDFCGNACFNKWIKNKKVVNKMSQWLNNKKITDDNVKKPCKLCGYCPYGQLVEAFPLGKTRTKFSCKVFGHDCPAFYHAENIVEE